MMERKRMVSTLFAVFSTFFVISCAWASDLILEGPLDGIYYSNNGVVAQGNCLVPSSADVTLAGTTGITLKPNFRVVLGGAFTAMIVSGADGDSDTLPDGWETLYLGTTSYGSEDDPDIDGYTNSSEYAAGTNPSDPDDAPYVDLAYGPLWDEQQGGGGLLAGTIRILTGNVMETREDVSFPSPSTFGLAFRATYNSRSRTWGPLGYGWTHTYEASLDPSFSGSLVRIKDGTGRGLYFQEGTPGVYNGLFNEASYVKIESGEFVWYRLDGSKYGFSSAGNLLWLDDEKGNRLEVEHDVNGLPLTVTDMASGRELTLTYVNGLLESISGPVTTAVSNGVWVTYGYDSNLNLTSVTYADGSGYSYVYDDLNDIHNLTERKDALNHQLMTWGYDSSDRAITFFSRDGKGMNITYVSGTQVEVTDAYDVVRTYSIGTAGGQRRVTAMTGIGSAPYSDHNSIRWVYDGSARLTEVEDAGGSVTQYQNYDSRGNPGTVKLAAGTSDERVLTFTYHSQMNAPLTRTEASVLGVGNKVTTWDYDSDYDGTPNEDSQKLVSRIVEQGFTKNGAGNTVSYEYVTTITYNGKGQVLSIDGPIAETDDTTALTYDATTGDLLTITRPMDLETDFSQYDAAGRAGRITDPNGQARTLTYDGRGRILTETHVSDSSQTTFAYTAGGEIHTVTDPDGVTRTYTYDQTYGRLDRVTAENGDYVAHGYDEWGNLVEKSNHMPDTTRTSWKRWDYEHASIPGKLYKEIHSDDTFTVYDYDDAGNMALVTDPKNQATSYSYDFMNRLESVLQPGDGLTSYEYDTQGNLISVTDAEDQETTYTYDDLGRLVSTTSPDTGTQTYVYDEAGNLVSKTDAKGITVTYGYDALNRLTGAEFLDPTQDVTYTYDQGTNGLGHLTGFTDPSGSTTYGYDARGRLTQKTSGISGHSYSSLSRSYTLGGRLSQLTYPSGRTVDFTRDATMKRITSATSTLGQTTKTLVQGLTYRPFGGPAHIENGTGGVVNNQSGECGCLEVANPGKDMETLFTYDQNRNLTGITATNHPRLNRTFGYDALNRLTSATSYYEELSYTYDKIGNRLTRTRNTVTDTYAYLTGTNKLDEITGQTSIDFTHDDNGNITVKGNQGFVYDQSNRLVEARLDGQLKGEYAYNALGQRASKTVHGTATVTTVFHYDFDGNIIGESEPDGDFTKEYLYMGSSRMTMVNVPTGAFYYYLNDHLGNPQYVTNEAGVVVWEARYLPFGQAIINGHSSVENNFRFPGQYYDSETGLHYNYHRYYDPKTGRYITADPIGMEGGINLFAYVENNPMNFIDPLGLRMGAIAVRPEYDPGWNEFGGTGGGAAGAAVGGAIGSQLIGNNEDDCDEKGKWKCEGYGQYEIIGANRHVIRGDKWIVAYGKTESDAALAWKKKVQAAAPRGYTARHIKPSCKKVR
jgi:RHS repeat-associated protein